MNDRFVDLNTPVYSFLRTSGSEREYSSSVRNIVLFNYLQELNLLYKSHPHSHSQFFLREA